MCDDCKRRLNTNPMRILDCKADAKTIVNGVNVIQNAPKINDYLTEEAENYFKEVINILSGFDVPFIVDHNLVRGLDYYTDTVFEFIIESNDELNGLALGGGGRYADMIKSMVGIDVSGMGYAIGVDRLIAVMENQGLFNDIFPRVDAVIMGLDKESKIEAMKLASVLRDNDLIIEMDYKNISMKPQFKLCDKVNPKYIIIIGETERLNGIYTVKNSDTKVQKNVKKEDLISYLKNNRGE